MKRPNTNEDVYYLRCDIVTGRLYRCLVALFQDFIEIQLSTALGQEWLDKIVELSSKIQPTDKGKDHKKQHAKGKDHKQVELSSEIQPTDKKSKQDDKDSKYDNYKISAKSVTTLKNLLDKKNDIGITMNRTAIDVTIANTILLFTCYYLVAVPQYYLEKEDAVDIISKKEGTSKGELNKLDREALHQHLLDLINKDITVVLECQNKISKYKPDDSEKDDSIKEYFKTDFYKKVQKLVNDKNELNSHMSEVNDYKATYARANDMLRDLEDFLTLLDKVWDHPAKDELIDRYTEKLAIADHLFGMPDFTEISNAIDHAISQMPAPKRTKSEKSNDKENVVRSREEHIANIKRCLDLLSNKKNHSLVNSDLRVEAAKSDDGLAGILLAFMYRCGWASGRDASEVLKEASEAPDSRADIWLLLAEGNRSTDKEIALIYYLGDAMLNDDAASFEVAGHLGMRLANFEVTKECFREAGASDKSSEAYKYYLAIRDIPDEEAFKAQAALINKKGVN